MRQVLLCNGLGDVVLLHVEYNNHWVLFEWARSTNQLTFYDSLADNNPVDSPVLRRKDFAFIEWLDSSSESQSVNRGMSSATAAVEQLQKQADTSMPVPWTTEHL
ncbi:hypothetical protein ColLi_13245 [Colletotrichum liriopes]|uniref:Uncharacterized protein n=1 Tax=Colletotrichum liriopes TaxID=708192 RepID=A0AA37H1X3_9PEZI|nr:hypothetical protein ColLi_13245 [Colletotrichum liriopes]